MPSFWRTFSHGLLLCQLAYVMNFLEVASFLEDALRLRHVNDIPQPECPRLLHASRHNGCGWIAWFVAICRYFAMKQCGTVAISKTCLLLPEVFRKRFWCNVILLLTALGIDGFCCRQWAFGYLAENSWLFQDHFLQDCHGDSFIIAFAAWVFVESVPEFVVRTSVSPRISPCNMLSGHKVIL